MQKNHRWPNLASIATDSSKFLLTTKIMNSEYNTSRHDPAQETRPGRERRASPRYPGTEDLYGYFRSEAPVLGTVHDVSRTGLGLQYILFDDKEPPQDTGEPLELKIFILGNTFTISGLKCRLAYDRPVSKPDASFDRLTRSRQCGIQFLDLTTEQEGVLEELIQKHTEY